MLWRPNLQRRKEAAAAASGLLRTLPVAAATAVGIVFCIVDDANRTCRPRRYALTALTLPLALDGAESSAPIAIDAELWQMVPAAPVRIATTTLASESPPDGSPAFVTFPLPSSFVVDATASTGASGPANISLVFKSASGLSWYYVIGGDAASGPRGSLGAVSAWFSLPASAGAEIGDAGWESAAAWTDSTFPGMRLMALKTACAQTPSRSPSVSRSVSRSRTSTRT
jgi:hypothetical protein